MTGWQYAKYRDHVCVCVCYVLCVIMCYVCAEAG